MEPSQSIPHVPEQICIDLYSVENYNIALYVNTTSTTTTKTQPIQHVLKILLLTALYYYIIIQFRMLSFYNVAIFVVVKTLLTPLHCCSDNIIFENLVESLNVLSFSNFINLF